MRLLIFTKSFFYSWPVLITLFLIISIPPWFIDTDTLFPTITASNFEFIYIALCCLFLSLLWFKKLQLSSWFRVIRSLIFLLLLFITGVWFNALWLQNDITEVDLYVLSGLLCIPLTSYTLALLLRNFIPHKDAQLRASSQSVLKGLLSIGAIFYGLILIADGYWNYSYSFHDVFFTYANPSVSEILLGLYLLLVASFHNIPYFFKKVFQAVKAVIHWVREDKIIQLSLVLTKEKEGKFKSVQEINAKVQEEKTSQEKQKDNKLLSQNIILEDIIRSIARWLENLSCNRAYPYDNYRSLFTFLTKTLPVIALLALVLTHFIELLTWRMSFVTYFIVMILTIGIVIRIVYVKKINKWIEDVILILKTYHELPKVQKPEFVFPKLSQFISIQRKIQRIALIICLISLVFFLVALFVIESDSVFYILLASVALFIGLYLLLRFSVWFITQFLYWLNAAEYHTLTTRGLLKKDSKISKKILN